VLFLSNFSLALKALCFYRWFKLVKAVLLLLYGSAESLLVVKDHRWWMLLIFHYLGIQIFPSFFLHHLKILN